MMFWTRMRNLEEEVSYLKADMKTHNDQYWALWHKYNRILDYLGVVEVEQKARVLLEEKGGPERGE